MSRTHIPFFINVTSLSLGAWSACCMLTKPYSFKTAQTPGANMYHWASGLKHVWTKSQREKIQKDLNSSKWSQTILFDNIPQVLWRSHNGQVYSVKGSWQIVVNQLLSHQTLSRDAFLFALKDGRLSAIHLLGSGTFICICIYKKQMSFSSTKTWACVWENEKPGRRWRGGQKPTLFG